MTTRKRSKFITTTLTLAFLQLQILACVFFIRNEMWTQFDSYAERMTQMDLRDDEIEVIANRLCPDRFTGSDSQRLFKDLETSMRRLDALEAKLK